MDEAGEMNGASVVAGEASEVLETTEASLDLVAMFVDAGIVRDRDPSVAPGGDDCRGVHGRDLVPQGISIIRFIGENCLGALAFEQIGGRGDVARLPGRDSEPQGPAKRVGKHVDLGGQSTSGTPQRLVLCPPFPAAAC